MESYYGFRKGDFNLWMSTEILCYQHSIFRFIRERDKNSPWHTANDVDTQFKKVLNDCGVGLTYALSPQAKGKVERPYRWIQDRLVRSAARKRIGNMKLLKKELSVLIHNYNTKWIHSTTQEIPVIRFENALKDRCLFKPLRVKQKSVEDIFALRVERFIDAYRKVSLSGLHISVPHGIPRAKVDIRLRPDVKTGVTDVRFWQDNVFLGNQRVKTCDLKMVQF